MANTKQIVLVGLGLLASAAVAVWAVEPPATRLTGKVLLLPSERALEGEIERQGEQYRIRRGTGEMSMPADKALRLCADWDEAYAWMASRANLADPDERLRLARWCLVNGQRERALAEVKAAQQMRPANTEGKKLLAALQSSAVATSSQSVPSSPPTPATPATLPPPLDLSADCQALFSTRVQPILLNACATCHGHGRGGDFQLVRWTEGGQRVVTQKNLAAVLAQVNRERPSVSPLLVKAASLHGNSTQPPLPGGRKSVPFQTLEQWVQLVMANNPHLRPESQATASVFAQRTDADLLPMPKAPSPKAMPMTMPQPASAPASAPLVVSRPASDAAAPKTDPQEKKGSPADPFDPAIFNSLGKQGK